jgi:hypothetical protein
VFGLISARGVVFGFLGGRRFGGVGGVVRFVGDEKQIGVMVFQ